MPTGVYQSKNRCGGVKGRSGVYKRIKGKKYGGFQKGHKIQVGEKQRKTSVRLV